MGGASVQRAWLGVMGADRMWAWLGELPRGGGVISVRVRAVTAASECGRLQITNH